METHNANPQGSNGSGRGLLVAGLIVLLAIAALIATSVTGHSAGSTRAQAAPAATADIPYLPEQFEIQMRAAEPAAPAATF